MSSAPREENKAASAGVMSNLMQLNKLTYRVPPSLSVAKERRYVENFAQQRTYGDSQTIVFNCNTGSQFLDGKRSYMAFKLKLPDATTGDLGHGSAANIFRSIRVKARSGVEICRLEGANLWTSVHQRWNCPRNAFETSLESQGYGADITGATDGTGTDLSNGANFVIPLHIIPCFNQSRLIQLDIHNRQSTKPFQRNPGNAGRRSINRSNPHTHKHAANKHNPGNGNHKNSLCPKHIRRELSLHKGHSRHNKFERDKRKLQGN